jgi:predicted esterase
MTRQNREEAIADNIAYVLSVIQRVTQNIPAEAPVVLTGFSQGVAMAFRAAANLNRAARVIACGGETPPELDTSALSRIHSVLIGRGVRDELYSAEKVASDERRLKAAGVAVEVATFEAAHEWTPEFADNCGRFLRTAP